MSWLQIRLIDSVLSSFSIHSYSYERSKHLITTLNLPHFRFSPYNQTASSNHVHFFCRAAKKTNQKKRLSPCGGHLQCWGCRLFEYNAVPLVRARSHGALTIASIDEEILVQLLNTSAVEYEINHEDQTNTDHRHFG